MVLLISIIVTISGCNEEPESSTVPLIADTEVMEITVSSAVLKGLVFSDGDLAIPELITSTTALTGGEITDIGGGETRSRLTAICSLTLCFSIQKIRFPYFQNRNLISLILYLPSTCTLNNFTGTGFVSGTTSLCACKNSKKQFYEP